MAVASTPAILLERVSKRFGRHTVLQDLSCQIFTGETIILWGPNGAGKTTALRCFLGLVPFAGAIRVLGRDVRKDGKAVRRAIGYVPQELGLYSEHTVEETVLFYARLRRVASADARALLATWHLQDVGSMRVRTLSGGMKQRLALVIGLLGDPAVMLFDEPTSHLDVNTRRDVSTLLERLKQRGKTVVLCSHRTGDVLSLADRVLVLEGGRKVAEGPPDQLRDQLEKTLVFGVAIAPADQARAAAALTQHGFHVQPNRSHLWVEVREHQKMVVLRTLAQAGITVQDFDVEGPTPEEERLQRS